MSNGKALSHWLPCPVTFISSHAEDQQDIMTATAMFIQERESLLVVSLARGHLTDKLIEKARAFTLVVASEDQAELARKLGSVKGLDGDKFERFAIRPLASRPGKPIVPEGAAAWMDCEMVGHHETGEYLLITARVVAQADLGKPPLVWHKDQFLGLRSV